MCKHIPPLCSRGPVEVTGCGSTGATCTVEVISGVTQETDTEEVGVESNNTVPLMVVAFIAATSQCSQMMDQKTLTRSSSEMSIICCSNESDWEDNGSRGVVEMPAAKMTVLFVPRCPCHRVSSIPIAGLSVE